MLVVGLDEGIDVLPELFDRGEGGTVQRLSLQDREPDFDLVEPGGPRRREVEMHVRVALEPAIVLGLVGVEIVEDDMDGRVRGGGDDIVHEVEEFDAPPALLVRGRDLAGGHLEGGKQGRGAVALVIVAMAGQRPAVRELQIALRPLQRLDRGLLVDADDDGVLGRRHVEPDHIGGLGDELGIVALAPGLAPGEVDLLRAQETPDILHIDIAERGRQQRPRPARIALRRRLDPAAPGCACSSRSCTSAQRPARPFRRDPQAASRRNAPATSTPCRSYIQPPVRSLGSPRRPPPATQSAPAAAAGALAQAMCEISCQAAHP